MKKNYLTICLSIFALTGFSQITLDASNTNTEIPTSFKLYHGDTTVFSPGSAGASATYDFSSIAIIDSSTAEFTAFDISINPDLYYQTSAPDYRIKFGMNYHFYSANGSGLTLCGRATNSSGISGIFEPMPYKDNGTVKVFSYPADFQDSETSSVKLDYNTVQYDPGSGNYFPITGGVLGDIVVTYDGYGTFKTPDGHTVNNVARIKITETYDRDGGGQILKVENVFYEYREEFTKHWIARIEDIKITATNGTVLQRKNNYFAESSVFVNVAELIKNSTPFVAYPNPTKNEATCSFEILNSESVKISVINLVGHEVIAFNEQVLTPGVYNQKINLEQFPSGIYLIKLQVGNQVSAQKIQKN